MKVLRWVDRKEMNRPILIVALKGLFDAAEAATAGVDLLIAKYSASLVAEIDPESFFNFQEERPVVHLGDNGREIRWPSNKIWGADCESGNHDLLLVSGIEPHLRWQTFSESLSEVARLMDVEMVITIGAMAGMAPHTRPLGVVGSAANPLIADRLGLGKPSYEGPTGLVGVLHDHLDKEGIPIISLRVSVPHYVPGPPNPEATRSLLARLELVTGVETFHGELNTAAKEWRKRIHAAVTNDAEMSNYVEELEKRIDESEIMPSGDDLAAELEAFLRDKRGE